MQTLSILLAIPALLFSAIGLVRSRQWYMIPVAAGLLALAGFLLNPLADSYSIIDLKERLTNFETLTLMCIIQMMCVVIAMVASQQMGDPIGAHNDAWKTKSRERRSILLGIVSSLPGPLLLVTMLLIEQGILSGTTESRPEPVGRMVGIAFASGLLGLSAILMVIPNRLQSPVHLLAGSAVLLISMFVPLVQDPLPETIVGIDWTSLRLLAIAMPAVAVAIVAGHRFSGTGFQPVDGETTA
ncbi:hypothetical protein Q31b_51770 [Novipirellula aureliae]|uniref:Uncharacterized protein n=1 Tax=Novipirellula aureliae TaxID=2527966 RepID=A0A5C6DGG1_9BACT|nr:hypothetical protein [Novipirellula aureliae]TWU35742.1 hypothetical protein Q31b_51770 [Novipirellula aureliae]